MKKIFNFLNKKLISLSLIFALLFNTNIQAFGQVSQLKHPMPDLDSFNFSMQEIGNQLKDLEQSGFINDILTQAASIDPEEICSQLSLCAKDGALDEDAIIALYLTAEELAKEITAAAPSVKQNQELISAIIESENDTLKDIIAESEKQYKAAGTFSQERQIFLAQIFPALLLINNEQTARFKPFIKQAYEDYFKAILKKYDSVKKLSNPGKELDNIEAIIYGYGFAADKIDINSPLMQLMLRTPLTPLSVQTVPAFISLLISLNDFPLIEKYLKAAAVREASEGSKTKDFMASMGDMLSISALIGNNDNLSTKYAGGNITPYGFYIISGEGENAVLGNIWEDLPAILVSEGGAQGIKVINNIFYNGLKFSPTTKNIYKARWEYGSLTPFIIGALATNKIEGKALSNMEAARKYYGANQAGLVEIDLMSYKMYDLNNPTYKRVRQLITAPYWGQIAADEKKEAAYNAFRAGTGKKPLDSDFDFKPSRNNFNVYKNTNFQSMFYNGNHFNGMIYNPKYQYIKNGKTVTGKTGLVLNESNAVRNNNKALWGGVLKYASYADTAISVVFLYQIAKLGVSVASRINQSVKLFRTVRAMGVKNGNFLSVIRNIHKRPALKTALNNRIVRAQKLTKLKKIQLKAARKVKNGTSPINSAKLELANANIEVANAETSLALKAQYLQEHPNVKASIDKEISVNKAKMQLSQNRANTLYDLHNSTKSSPNQLKQTHDYILQNTYREPQFSAQTQSYIEAYKNYHAAANKAKRAKEVLSNLKTSPWKDPLAPLAKEPSVNMLGQKVKPSVSSEDIARAVRKVDASDAYFASPEGKAALKANKKKFDARARFYNALDKYTFGIGGKALTFINSKATALTVPLLLNYNISTVNPAAFAKFSNPRVFAIEAVDPRLFSNMPAGRLIADVAPLKAPASILKQAQAPVSAKTIAMPAVKPAAIAPKAPLTPLVTTNINTGATASLRNIYGKTINFNFTPQTFINQPLVADAIALPEGWKLFNRTDNVLNQKLIASVEPEKFFNDGTYNISDVQSDPIVTAGFLIPFFFNKIIHIGSNHILDIKQSNKQAKLILSKTSPLPSQLVTILKGNADKSYKAQAINKLYSQGQLNESVKQLPESSKQHLKTSEGLLKLYEASLFDLSIANVQDVKYPIQSRLSDKERRDLEKRKEVANNLNEEISSTISDWGNGITSFETPATNGQLIEASLRTQQFVAENASHGIVTKNGTYYENNIPVYYRDKDGNLSNNPRIILSYSQISPFTLFLAKLGLADKKGITVPHGLVLALDEEGKTKLVMPRGNLFEVENNKKSKKIIIDGTETNRVAIDSEFTSSDLIEIANMLERLPDIGFEINLNKPDSFKIFLAFHALFIGNDAGNTLTGQFKGYAEAAGGNAAVNGMGGVGYLTPFIGAALMKKITEWGHVKTIRAVYGLALAALAYSFFWVGMRGSYIFPADAQWYDFLNLAIPTTVMVLGGSILNTSVSTLLNIYKDPVARTTAHLQYANNKNYSRLAVSAITGLALVSGLGLNWSVVVPLASVLLIAAGALLFNTRIYDKYKQERAAKRQAAIEQIQNLNSMTPEEIQKIKASAKEAKNAAKAMDEEFKKIYKSEILTRPEMKDIAHRVSKLYASYAASLLVVTQALTMSAKEVVDTGIGEYLSAGLLLLVAAPILLTYLYQKIAGKDSSIPANLKKFGVPAAFFLTTLATMYFASDGKGLGMAFTTLCLLTTTMMRVFSTELIKSKKATDDQLAGISIPVIAAATTLLAFMPTDGLGALGSLAVVLALYAGTAVPGQLDSARMQNFITSIYKDKKEQLKNMGLTDEQIAQAEKKLKAEEKYMASKGAAKFSYLNGRGILGIAFTVAAAYLMLDLKIDALKPLQDFISSGIKMITGTAGDNESFTVSRIVFIYSAIVAWIMAAENMHLTRSAKGLFVKQPITQQNINDGKISAKNFSITDKNAAINLSAMDKEIKDINGIVFGNGKSSETKMTEILNKLFVINNRLCAIAEINGPKAIEKSVENLKFIIRNLGKMIANNDLSFSYHQQYNKLVNALKSDKPVYVEEGLYKTPVSLSNYERGLMYVREVQHLAEDIANYEDVNEHTYSRFNTYYTKAVQDLTQYAQDNPIDSRRVNIEIRKLVEVGRELEAVDHSKNTVASQEDITKLQETIKLFKFTRETKKPKTDI